MWCTYLCNQDRVFRKRIQTDSITCCCLFEMKCCGRLNYLRWMDNVFGTRVEKITGWTLSFSSWSVSLNSRKKLWHFYIFSLYVCNCHSFFDRSVVCFLFWVIVLSYIIGYSLSFLWLINLFWWNKISK